MRSISRAALLALAIGAAAPAAAAAQQGTVKLAFVNPAALFENAPGRAAAETAFKKETDTFRTQLQAMNDNLQAQVSAYQKVQATLTPAQRKTREDALRAQDDSLQSRQQQFQSRAQTRQNELMAPIMEQVRKVIEDIRVEDGYSMILSNEPGATVILAADKNLDITDRVVARLRTVAATSAPKTAAPVSAPAGVTRPKPPTE